MRQLQWFCYPQKCFFFLQSRVDLRVDNLYLFRLTRQKSFKFSLAYEFSIWGWNFACPVMLIVTWKTAFSTGFGPNPINMNWNVAVQIPLRRIKSHFIGFTLTTIFFCNLFSSCTLSLQILQKMVKYWNNTKIIKISILKYLFFPLSFQFCRTSQNLILSITPNGSGD